MVNQALGNLPSAFEPGIELFGISQERSWIRTARRWNSRPQVLGSLADSADGVLWGGGLLDSIGNYVYGSLVNYNTTIMLGTTKLASVTRSTPRMAAALPELPMQQAVMVRLVRILADSMTNYFDPVFRKTGLSESSFHVLCLLLASEDGKASPSELSEMVGTSRGNMTRILEHLVTEGLVSRTVEPMDARRHVIAITPAGRNTADATVPKISQPLLRAFARLTPDQFDALKGALRTVILSLDDRN